VKFREWSAMEGATLDLTSQEATTRQRRKFITQIGRFDEFAGRQPRQPLCKAGLPASSGAARIARLRRRVLVIRLSRNAAMLNFFNLSANLGS
jgi:hypothetical protein